MTGLFAVYRREMLALCLLDRIPIGVRRGQLVQLRHVGASVHRCFSFDVLSFRQNRAGDIDREAVERGSVAPV